MSPTLLDRVRAHVREIDPYKPGKPIEEVERELGLRAVKLASNENPLGPSPLAIEAARAALDASHRYPDGGGYALRQKIAARLGVHRDEIILGDGTSEVIDLAARALLTPEDEGLSCAGSFPLYYIAIRASGARIVTAPLKDYVFDLDALAAAVTPRTRVIYLSNPNNPTGTWFSADVLEKFLARVPEDVLIVLDEAYCDYVAEPGYSRSLEQRREHSNLLVLRTFSKIYGLAGLRIGYGIGLPGLLAEMNKLRTPFNTSGVAQAAALAALDDAAHVRRSVESNRAGLAQLTDGMRKLGLRCVPSVTNFIFVELDSDAAPVAQSLLERGVIVRPLAWMGFPRAIRVSIGTPEENDKFLNAIQQVLAPSAGQKTAGQQTLGQPAAGKRK